MIDKWYVIGFLGQAFFFSRFLVQWLVSEAKKQSTMPVAFWYLSVLGGLLLLAYAIFRHDPVFILGQSLGQVVYVRNLILIRKRRAAENPLAPPAGGHAAP
jgi:lipid-A-disaccharide synthase-like uncharacterized protein